MMPPTNFAPRPKLSGGDYSLLFCTYKFKKIFIYVLCCNLVVGLEWEAIYSL